MTISPGRRAVEYHARSCYSKAELVVDPSADSRRPARGHAEDAEMKARFPTFDFSNIRPHWPPNKVFAQRATAARSDARRVGKGCDSPGSSGEGPYHKNRK